MKYFLLKTVAIAAVVIFSIGTATSFAGAATLKLGTMYPEISNYGKAMNKFAELTTKYSNDQIKVKVYHGGQLGKKMQLIEKIQSGQTDIYIETIDVFESYVPEAYYQSMPYLFKNVNHTRKFLNSDWYTDNVKAKFLKRGITIPDQYFNWERGPYRVLISKVPVMTLEDLTTIKLRVYASEMYRKSWQALGANTTNVDWTEVYLALKQNLIQAVTSPINLAKPMKFTEAAKYIIRMDEFPQLLIVYINSKTYEKLSSSQKEALKKAYNEAGDHYTKLNYDSSESDISYMLEKDNATFIRLPLSAWRKKIRPLYIQLEADGSISKGFYEMVQSLN